MIKFFRFVWRDFETKQQAEGFELALSITWMCVLWCKIEAEKF